MTTLGARFASALAARGVDTVFGIPGVHNVALYQGLAEAGLRHVLARHEQGAAFMADGYARATGRPGVCFTITGPGLTNALTALGQAYSDSVPVLAVTSALPDVAARRGQLHQMRDQRAAADTLCAWSEEARDAASAYALLDRAMVGFACARPRPCHIQMTIPALEAVAEEACAPAPRPELPKTDHDTLYAVIDAVLAAEKPLFVFGGGARGGAAVIPDLLRMTGAAAFTTYAGRQRADCAGAGLFRQRAGSGGHLCLAGRGCAARAIAPDAGSARRGGHPVRLVRRGARCGVGLCPAGSCDGGLCLRKAAPLPYPDDDPGAGGGG